MRETTQQQDYQPGDKVWITRFGKIREAVVKGPSRYRWNKDEMDCVPVGVKSATSVRPCAIFPTREAAIASERAHYASLMKQGENLIATAKRGLKRLAQQEQTR